MAAPGADTVRKCRVGHEVRIPGLHPLPWARWASSFTLSQRQLLLHASISVLLLLSFFYVTGVTGLAIECHTYHR